MKTILITGANGFVGRVLSRRLLDLDYNVRILTRLKQESSGGILCENCKVFTIDASNPGSVLADAMKDVDVVVHLAARVHIMNDMSSDPLDDFRKVNVGWTKQLAEAALASKVKRFIFISSLHVNGSVSLDHPFNEGDKPNPPSSYAVSKWEAEQYLNDLVKRTDMDVVIIRPPLVYGPEVKANFLSLLKLTKIGLPLPVGLLKNKRSMVSVHNLVDFITCCIENPRASNETFLISDDCDISTKELFEKLTRLFGKRPLLLPIPAKILYFFGSLLGKKDIVGRLCSPLQVDIAKAKNLLNWQPVQTLDDGLKETVDWYKKGYLS